MWNAIHLIGSTTTSTGLQAMVDIKKGHTNAFQWLNMLFEK
jgi:hypothetical protein